MIDSLTLTMNRVRQAAITKEIIEIVSGAAALRNASRCCFSKLFETENLWQKTLEK